MKCLTRNRLLLAGVMALVLAAGCSSQLARTDGENGTDSASRAAVLAVPPMDVTGSAGSFESLESKAATTSLPRRLMVYKVRPANVTRNDFEAQARRLGFEGKAEDLGEKYLLAGADANFEVDKLTGSFDYTTDAFERQTQPLQQLLSDADYRQKAESFLNSAGLMEENAEFRDVNRGNVVGTYDNGQWVERPYMVEVRFSHKPLAGVAFDKGVGPKIVVQFGEDGEILGALSVWRNIEPFAQYDLKSTTAAIEAVKRGEATLFDVDKRDNGIVDEISISYMNEPLGYDQQYVLPAYILRGTTDGGRRFTAVTRAVPDALLRIDPSLTGRRVPAPLSTGKK